MSSEYENIDKSQIEGLVDKYRKVLKNQDQDKFNEEDVKAKFINPLLEALGWDVRGLDQVKFEQTTLTGRTDFGLRLNEGEDPVLFVEAKSFSESLDGYRVKRGEKITYPQQAIDDAWSMKVDWAILTNFKKLRLYYSHVKKPEDGLQFELKFKDFLSDKGLEKLNSLSKETVEAGSLERYEARRTREDVNTEFVNDLYTLRKDLAGAISEKNDLSADEIRESVQRILDRLVVIRVAEDREIIHRESLHKMVEAWKTTSIDPSVRTLMKDLKNLFRDFDSVYNSELFDEHTCEDLNIENDTIKETIDTLYNYNFDLIDADVLGSMYEDYIGHILEEKEEGVDIKEDYQTRKKTGIYYTPTFVVDFLVDHTLGRLIRDSSGPEEVSKINVLDPACGSGSFLIKAFDYFKDYYEGYNRKIQSKAEKSGKLTDYDMITNINKKILDQNLYGVDLDEQAAEIASVNLMLKGMQKSERLPLILGKNIKVGNSLISELINEIEEFFDNPENRKPMLWEEEFSDVFQDGGFDVVIGNPPYFTIRKSGTRGEATFYYEYLKNSTKWRNLFRSDSDIYYYFIIQSLWLLKDGGHFGFIIENYWLENDWADKLRKYILEHSKVRMIVHFGSIKIFPEAGNDTCLLILQKETNEKSKKNHKVKVVRAKKVKRDNRELLDYISNHIQEQRYSDEFIDVFWVNQSSLSPNKWVLSKEEELLDRLKIGRKNVVTLGDTEVDGKRVKGICNIGKGQESHKNEVFVVDKESIETKNLEKNLLKPVVKSGDISRYSIKFQDRYLILTLNETKIENYPNVLKYLKNNREKLEDRHRVKENIRKWHAIGVPQNLDIFEADEKILVPYRAKRASFAYDDQGYFNDGGDVRGIACKPNCKLDLKYILGLLNSKLLTFWYRIAGKEKGGMLEFFTTPLSRIPIRNIDFSNKEEKRKHDKIVKLVEDIQVLKKQERWISETFENLLKNYDMTEEEPLSYFFDPKDRSKLEKFSINVAETRKMDRGEAGVIDEYKVDLKENSVLISVRYKDKSNYREVLDLHFEDAALKEFFFLALKRNEGDKNYRSEKPVFETTMGDMTVPKSSETDLIDENVEAFQTMMEVLRKEFEKKVSKKWENSSVKKLDLTRIERAIEETDRNIDRVVYDLYGLTEEEVETVESHV